MYYNELGITNTMRVKIEIASRQNNNMDDISRWIANAAMSAGWRKSIGLKTTFAELEQQEGINPPKQQKGKLVSGTKNAKTAGQPKPKPKNTSNVL